MTRNNVPLEKTLAKLAERRLLKTLLHYSNEKIQGVCQPPIFGQVAQVAGQLHGLLDDSDYLDTFQSGFQTKLKMRLVDDLYKEGDMGS